MYSRSIEAVRRRRREDRLWLGVSLGIHFAVIVALVYLTPVRELVRQVTHQTQPEAAMSANVLRDLAEAIEGRAGGQIKENTTELHRVLREMGDMQAKVAVEFNAFAELQTNTAAADALEEMQRAIKEMGSAVDSIGRDAPIEETDRSQALAEQAQERAGQKLDMTPFDVKAPAEAQKQAIGVHQEAKAAHDQDRTLKDQALARQRALTAEQARGDQRRQELESAEEQARSQAEVGRLAKTVEDQDQATTQARDALDKVQEQERQAHQSALDKQKTALQSQEQALAALEAAIKQNRRQMAQAASTQPLGGATQAPAAMPASDSSAQDAAQGQLDFAALYESARTAEDRIADTLKEVRAMDLAMVRDITLDEARGDIDVVRPVRPALDNDLLREDVRSGERFTAHQAELRTALRETASMVNLAHRMLEMANQSVEKMKFGTDVPMAAYAAMERPDFELIIRELAMEDVAGRFSDMSGMMLAAEQMQGQAGRAGQMGQMGMQGMQGQQGESGEGPQGGAPIRRGQDIQDLTQDMPGAESMMAFGFGEGAEGFPQLPPDVPAVGARQVGPNGVPTMFMYIDSWYTIGPFPNPNRINIDREFPPDSLVDLDATYTGKDGRTIRWQFVQSDKAQVIPADPDQYGIWYAYTEFYCDKPRDVWIAAGTDDRGTLKINGVPVWISSKRLKGWDIDEVWRRVHLSQGTNRILYRVENGWLHIGFSLLLKLDDQ